MKSLKTILAIALSTAGLGTAVTLGAFSTNKSVSETKATNNSRLNIFIHNSSWWKTDSAWIGLTYNSTTDSSPLHITADTDFGVSYGFSWMDFGDTNYGVLSMITDLDAIAAGDYNNLGIRRRNPSDLSDDWGNLWGSQPNIVNSTNTLVIDNNNSLVVDWGYYWKITTYSGLTSYSSLTGANKKAYLKSASYNFMPDDPTDVPVGYEFVGWYTDTSFTNQWTTSSKPTADTTLYAKYESVSVQFDDGDSLSYNAENKEYEGIKYFDAGAKFHIVKTLGSVTTNCATLNSYMSSSVATSDGTDVTVVAAGTYAVYFKKSDNTIWIQTAEASLEAYMYAGYFLANIGCDSTGVNLPSGWSTCASRYSTLSSDAKDYIYAFDVSGAEDNDNIVKMIERYNHACNAHPSLEKFIKNSSGASRTIPSGSRNIMPIANDSNTIVIITIVSVISLSALGAFFLLRKKRKEQ